MPSAAVVISALRVKIDSHDSMLIHLKSALFIFNPTALRVAKTLQSFGRSECSRVNAG